VLLHINAGKYILNHRVAAIFFADIPVIFLCQEGFFAVCVRFSRQFQRVRDERRDLVTARVKRLLYGFLHPYNARRGCLAALATVRQLSSQASAAAGIGIGRSGTLIRVSGGDASASRSGCRARDPPVPPSAGDSRPMVGARGKLPQLGAWHYTPLVVPQWDQGQNHHASFTFLDGISTRFSPPLQSPATTGFARSIGSPKTSSEEKTHFKALH
jgi:hypothetical protein